MRSAKSKFKLGDRVVMNQLGKSRYRTSAAKLRMGTVLGFSRSGIMVRIRLDGMKSVQGYYYKFWRKCKQLDDPFSFPLQETIALGVRSPLGERVASTKIASIPEFDAFIPPVEPLVRPEIHDPSIETSALPLSAWQRLQNFVRGIK